MKLWEKTKRPAPNRKIKRTKTKNKLDGPVLFTEAENLILANWGLRFTWPSPERKGEVLAAKRLKAKLNSNKKIPSLKKDPSRQVTRREDIRMFKNLRSHVKQENLKNHH